MASTLYEYYLGQGKSLPGVGARFTDPAFAAAASAAGISANSYSGTADQNNKILANLQKGSSAPPAPVGGGSSAGASSGSSGGSQGGQGGDKDFSSVSYEEEISPLGSLRIALRAALNEAGQRRTAGNFSALGDLTEGLPPGSMRSVVDLIRGSTAPAIETVFSDIVSGFEAELESKRKEKEKIQELRLEYGSAIPAGVTSFDEAIKYAEPLIDEERRLALEDDRAELAEEGDIDGYAICLAQGGTASSCGIPNKYRADAQIRAEEYILKEKEAAFTDEKKKISDRISRKASTYAQEREQIWANANLSFDEQRDLIDYIDTLETIAKTGKGPMSVYNPPAPNITAAPSSGNRPKVNPFDLTGSGQQSGGADVGTPNFKPFMDLFSGLMK